MKEFLTKEEKIDFCMKSIDNIKYLKRHESHYFLCLKLEIFIQQKRNNKELIYQFINSNFYGYDDYRYFLYDAFPELFNNFPAKFNFSICGALEDDKQRLKILRKTLRQLTNGKINR